MLSELTRLFYPKAISNATPGRPVRWVLYALCAAVAYLSLAATQELSAQQINSTVTQVINAKSFSLQTGDTVRLASLQAPNVQETTGKKRPGEPMGEQAREALQSLVQGKEVRLELGDEPRDRHGRLVAQAYLADGQWIQGALLEAGMVMVYPFSDSGAQLDDMLQLEQQARSAKKGIWAHPYFSVISDREAADYKERFKLVEGTVQEVAEVRGNTYLNFGEDWKTDFTAFIAKEDRKYFKTTDLESLKHKKIRVRGWLYSRNGPAMDLNAPGQIELLE